MTISVDSHSIKLETVGGEMVEVALLGATVYAYKSNGIERLFKSTKSSIEGPSAIRGGVPICWPIFGAPPKDDKRFNKMKSHGFARTSLWSFNQSASSETSEGIKAIFNLSSSPSTLQLYNSPFKLTYTVFLTEVNLNLSFKVESTSSFEMSFQALFHTYIRLPSNILPSQVTVTPLKGLRFYDKARAGIISTEDRAIVEVNGPAGEVDRVYYNAPDTLEMELGGAGRVTLVKKNLSDWELWTPGQKGAAIVDMEEGGASRFVCLEPGQVGTFIDLKEGSVWEGSTSLTFFD